MAKHIKKLKIPNKPKILHITVGTDDWEPTNDELDDIVDLFTIAADDPVGAVVATRRGIFVEVIDL